MYKSQLIFFTFQIINTLPGGNYEKWKNERSRGKMSANHVSTGKVSRPGEKHLESVKNE